MLKSGASSLGSNVEKELRVVWTWTMVLKSGYIRYVEAPQRGERTQLRL